MLINSGLVNKIFVSELLKNLQKKWVLWHD